MFDTFVELQQRLLKLIFTASTFVAQEEGGNVETKPTTSLVESLGKVSIEITPSLFDGRVVGSSNQLQSLSDQRHGKRARAHTHG